MAALITKTFGTVTTPFIGFKHVGHYCRLFNGTLYVLPMMADDSMAVDIPNEVGWDTIDPDTDKALTNIGQWLEAMPNDIP